ncbi:MULTISPECIES: pentapeptide repeat-containing protein [Fischerella]|uniref:Pentapeptide repeat-containing protein n=1 Tax=Fischerella muscicola CCMEE 5323 TaxID=2019572 RepID=A0A2N6JXS6_FISMU|nr:MULTISPECIES: pentapeptide repeat-containing protein [Fischerella]MBD2431202.1 pentapeptide repeat-containing protein [Fischerella sp. FACHB-380]PLZ85399.1 pentapeptide repeat-containing protein [Fischerella muscicola CCMEE 5323]
MRQTILSALNSWLQPSHKTVLLFDSVAAAHEIAFMLNGEWDECNGVNLSKCDEVAINTAASLVDTSWCYQGTSVAVLSKLTTDELLRRYGIGERNFTNANLRCANLCSLLLSEVNFNWAKLSWANLSGANLSKSDLTAADMQNANLSDINLSKSRLVRANLVSTNLSRADLKGADLSHACLRNANLYQADLRGANIFQTDFQGADCSGAIFDTVIPK